MNPLAERGQLRNMPEFRELGFTDAEVRMESGSGGMTFRGYASIFNSSYTIQDSYGEYRETVSQGAFDKALAAGADCVFLIGHAGGPLARSKSGTLTLRTDGR